jgi:type IV pilus assembly protein PilM
MNMMAHPPLAIEISAERLAGARWSRANSIEDVVVEDLPAGSIVPSTTEPNLVNFEAVRTALSKICDRLHAKDEEVTLIIPDPVIRVFVQHFDEFPRSPQEALPILRWKLKKSVPFAIEETRISYMRQAPRDGGVDIVTALSRERIVREYDSLTESVSLHAGVILSDSLACLALVENEKPILMARVSNTSLTTAIVRNGVLCGFRCTELPAHGSELTPRMFSDEIFPLAAYYQDTWQEPVHAVRLGGLGERLPEFVGLLEQEFHCKVEALLPPARSQGLIPESASQLIKLDLDSLAGWMVHYG